MPEVGETIEVVRKGIPSSAVVDSVHPAAFGCTFANGARGVVLAHDVVPRPAPVDPNDNSDPGDEHTPPPVPTDDGFVLGSIQGSFVGSILPAESSLPAEDAEGGIIVKTAGSSSSWPVGAKGSGTIIDRVPQLIPAASLESMQSGETGELMSPVEGDTVSSVPTAEALVAEVPAVEAPKHADTPAPAKLTKAQRKALSAAKKGQKGATS